jgi:hypothetical protein
MSETDTRDGAVNESTFITNRSLGSRHLHGLSKHGASKEHLHGTPNHRMDLVR